MLIQAVSGATFLHTVVGRVAIWVSWALAISLNWPLAFSFLLFDAETVIVPSIPMRVHLHVLLTLYTSLLVIFGLFLTTQTVPLKHTYAEPDFKHKTVSAWLFDIWWKIYILNATAVRWRNLEFRAVNPNWFFDLFEKRRKQDWTYLNRRLQLLHLFLPFDLVTGLLRLIP